MNNERNLFGLIDERPEDTAPTKKVPQRQLRCVKEFMRDGQWRSLAEIARAIGESQPSVSARLRDLRKEKYGRHVVLRLKIGGCFKYRLFVREDPFS